MRKLFVAIALAGCVPGADPGVFARSGGDPEAHDAGATTIADGSRAPADGSSAMDASTDAAPFDAAACVVCDDFEHAAVGSAPSAPWTIATPSCSGAGKMAIDDAQAHGGARSVKVVGGGGYCDHVFIAAPIPALAVTWVRFFVRLDAPLGNGHTTFLAMRDARASKDVRMGGQNGVLMFNREADDATLPEMSPAGVALSVAPRARAWTCIETAIDSAARTIRTWVDGALVAGLVEDGVPTPDVDATWLRDAAWAPDLVDVRFGWESYAGQAITLWFDDVAIGPARFGCGP